MLDCTRGDACSRLYNIRVVVSGTVMLVRTISRNDQASMILLWELIFPECMLA
jgi:hypothetical protein